MFNERFTILYSLHFFSNDEKVSETYKQYRCQKEERRGKETEINGNEKCAEYIFSSAEVHYICFYDFDIVLNTPPVC
ncbi:hypothetical protein QQG55_41390 [Brugia pahangi]